MSEGHGKKIKENDAIDLLHAVVPLRASSQPPIGVSSGPGAHFVRPQFKQRCAKWFAKRRRI
jgi:hypothetical protein